MVLSRVAFCRAAVKETKPRKACVLLGQGVDVTNNIEWYLDRYATHAMADANHQQMTEGTVGRRSVQGHGVLLGHTKQVHDHSNHPSH